MLVTVDPAANSVKGGLQKTNAHGLGPNPLRRTSRNSICLDLMVRKPLIIFTLTNSIEMYRKMYLDVFGFIWLHHLTL